MTDTFYPTPPIRFPACPIDGSWLIVFPLSHAMCLECEWLLWSMHPDGQEPGRELLSHDEWALRLQAAPGSVPRPREDIMTICEECGTEPAAAGCACQLCPQCCIEVCDESGDPHTEICCPP